MSLIGGKLRFGDFVLDEDEKSLTRDGQRVPLPPKAMGLLSVLIEKSGRIVEKGSLFEQVWPDAFVEEGNLTYTVRLLRKALGDNAEKPRFIETVPKRGYRFIAEVSRCDTTDQPVGGPSPADPTDSSKGEVLSFTGSRQRIEENSSFPRAGGLALAEDRSRGKEKGYPASTIELPIAPSGKTIAKATGSKDTIDRRKFAAIAFGLFFIGAAALGYYFLSQEKAYSEEKRSIVVLPFVNQSNSNDLEYLADGISESLINSLSELRQLKVVARATSFTYKNRNLDPLDVGRQLRVDAVLTGKLTLLEDTLVAQVDLINVEDGSQLWGERYTRKLGDLPSIPQGISREIVKRLQPRLESEIAKHSEQRFSLSSEAYQLDLKGRFFWNRRTEEGLQKGIGYFEQAIAQEPEYALAYVGLADSYNVMGFYSFLPPDQAFPKAKVAAGKALELDQDLAEAYNSLAYANLYYDWNFESAEKAFLRTIELKPNYSVAHQWYGNLLTARGRWDEALLSFRRAQDLDPLSPVITAVPAWTYYYARQYDKAIEPCGKAIELDPNFALAHTWLGQAYERKGDHQRALTEFKQALNISKGAPEVAALLAHAYAVAGDRNSALVIVDELIERSKHRYVSPYHIATVYVGLGDTESAFKWLEIALKDRQHVMIFLNYDPRLDDLRSDARFQDLSRRMGLPQ
jgi:DNA-binding winged helix-turn-helix (wHTH) protein/TolB-like protein/Tfp pilus assembly protein PilF